jgi:hypothetical protein
MRRHWFLRGLKFILLAIVAVAVFGFATMHLWNWLMPGLFAWKLIGFWQAVGLVVLSRILLGGFRGRHGGPGMHWRHRMNERWEQMTPEEREKFRTGMGRRCGHSNAPEEKTTA